MANATYNTASRGSDSHRREQDVRYLQTAGVSHPARRKKNSNSPGWLKRLASRPDGHIPQEVVEDGIVIIICILALGYYLGHLVWALWKGAL